MPFDALGRLAIGQAAGGPPVTLTADLYSDADTFYSAQITQTVFPGLYSDADTFRSATVVSGNNLAQNDTFTNDSTFYSPSISQTLVASLYADADTFYPQTLLSHVQVFPNFYESFATFYSPEVVKSVAVTLFTPPWQFYNISNEQFYSPTVRRIQLGDGGKRMRLVRRNYLIETTFSNQ